MLTPKKRAALQRQRLDAIDAEIKRRERMKVDNAFQQLVDRLNEMAERLRASPDWREPTAEEQEHYRRSIENLFSRYAPGA